MQVFPSQFFSALPRLLFFVGLSLHFLFFDLGLLEIIMTLLHDRELLLLSELGQLIRSCQGRGPLVQKLCLMSVVLFPLFFYVAPSAPPSSLMREIRWCWRSRWSGWRRRYYWSRRSRYDHWLLILLLSWSRRHHRCEWWRRLFLFFRLSRLLFLLGFGCLSRTSFRRRWLLLNWKLHDSIDFSSE